MIIHHHIIQDKLILTFWFNSKVIDRLSTKKNSTGKLFANLHGLVKSSLHLHEYYEAPCTFVQFL